MKTYFKTLSVATLTLGLFFFANSAEASPSISLQKAQEIATNHAQVPLSEANFTQAKFEDNLINPEYEIEFFHNNVEYEYEIDADNGEITSYSQENHNNLQQGINTQSPNYISEEQAKEVAFNHANVNSPSFVRVKLDLDDGIAMYEVEFTANNSKYEYEINAINSKIIKIEKE